MKAIIKYLLLPDPYYRRYVTALSLLFCLLLIALMVSASSGPVDFSYLSLLLGNLTQDQMDVFLSIRLPRVLLAGLVGLSLAVSGAVMQGIFRNPLADPSLIGISSGAALAVGLVIVLAIPASGTIGIYVLSVAAFAGSLLTCLLVMHFAKISGSFSAIYILLAGIAINSLAGAGTGLLTYLSNDTQLRTLTFWTMGSLSGALWPSVIVAASIVIPTTYYLAKKSLQLNVLLLGDSEAQYLGVNCDRLKRNIIICTSLSVGTAVAVSGIIGFVGLVVPHLIRLLIGPDHRIVIPASAVLGAFLLVSADSIARTVLTPSELPVGILTSLIGGPFFLWLLFKQYAKQEV